MQEREQKVYQVLDELGIKYEVHQHPPVYTVEEAEKYWADIEGSHCKNLFLRNQKGKRHFLVILTQSKQVDFNKDVYKRQPYVQRRIEWLVLHPPWIDPFGSFDWHSKRSDHIQRKLPWNCLLYTSRCV